MFSLVLSPSRYRKEMLRRGGCYLAKSYTTEFIVRPGLFCPDLHALEHVEEVVHPRQMMNILKNGHQQSGRDGDGAGQQHSGKPGPPQVQEALSKHESEKNISMHASLY